MQLILLITLLGHAPSVDEEKAIARDIVRACPGKQAAADKASADFHAKDRRGEALAAYRGFVAGCAQNISVLHARVATLLLDQGDFKGAEASARRAVALEPNDSNRFTLLAVLSRANHPDARALYDGLKAYQGPRDDFLAGLAYIAFHLDDNATMKSASQRAIALDTKWWQPWFCAAMAEGIEPSPDYAKALKWLDRADALGAPVKTTSGIREALETAMRRK
jgi:tetratricopeptide (TPR) repeat protein